jgi:hypothetical protein
MIKCREPGEAPHLVESKPMENDKDDDQGLEEHGHASEVTLQRVAGAA